MPIIPSEIHFTCLYEPLTTVEKINIIDWANQNPSYKTSLWTTGSEIEPLALQIKEALEMHRTNINPQILPDIVPDHLTVTWEFLRQPHAITIKNFDRLDRKMQKGTLLNIAIEHRRRHVIQDHCGLVIIFNDGGIFINKTVKATCKPLPVALNAPYGILFSNSPDSSDHLSSHIIAADVENPVIDRILHLTTTTYRSFMLEVIAPPPDFLKTLTEKRQLVTQLEQMTLQDDSDENLMKYLQAKKEHAAACASDPYAPLTSTACIEGILELFTRMGKPTHVAIGNSPTPEYWEDMCDRFTNFKPEEHHPRPVPPPISNFQLYSFQKAARIPLRLFEEPHF